MAGALQALVGTCPMVEQSINPIEMIKTMFVKKIHDLIQNMEDEDLQGDLVVELGCSEPDSRVELNKYVREVAKEVYVDLAKDYNVPVNDEGYIEDGGVPIHDIVFPLQVKKKKVKKVIVRVEEKTWMNS